MQGSRKQQSKSVPLAEAAPALCLGQIVLSSLILSCLLVRGRKAVPPTSLQQAWGRKSGGGGPGRPGTQAAALSLRTERGGPRAMPGPTQGSPSRSPPGLRGLGTGFIIAVRLVAVPHVHGKRTGDRDTGGGGRGVSVGKEEMEGA